MFPGLYVILDAESLGESELSIAAELADAGVRLVQYRNKTASSRTLFHACRKLAQLLAPKGTQLIVNDRPDLAAMCPARGVHVGQDDLDVDTARSICGPSLWVGVSTHSVEQLAAANSTSADYIAVGPIFSTGTKKRPDPVVGTEFIRRVRGLTRRPLVAIGGITLERSEEVLRSGADSLAVARDIISGASPGDRAREFLTLVEKVKGSHN